MADSRDRKAGRKNIGVDGVGSSAQSKISSEMMVSLHLLLPRRPWGNVQWKLSPPLHKINKVVLICNGKAMSGSANWMFSMMLDPTFVKQCCTIAAEHFSPVCVNGHPQAPPLCSRAG